MAISADLRRREIVAVPLRVHFLPSLVDPSELVGATSVVIDVLRASTTIVEALAAGAREVIACREVDEARARTSAFSAGQVVLGGERGGLRIEGFDLGNSPAEYTAQTVGGRSVIFTTTNGTRALAVCESAKPVLIAGLVNLSAVVEAIDRGRAVHIICAGTRGAITREDVLVAGCLVDRLARGDEARFDLNDSARIACGAWRDAIGGRGNEHDASLVVDRWTAALAETQGGRNLASIGLSDDIAWSAQVDLHRLVPIYNPADGAIRARE